MIFDILNHDGLEDDPALPKQLQGSFYARGWYWERGVFRGGIGNVTANIDREGKAGEMQ